MAEVNFEIDLFRFQINGNQIKADKPKIINAKTIQGPGLGNSPFPVIESEVAMTEAFVFSLFPF